MIMIQEERGRYGEERCYRSEEDCVESEEGQCNRMVWDTKRSWQYIRDANVYNDDNESL